MLLIFISSMTFGQVEKGKWMLGAGSNLGIDIGKLSSGTNDNSSEYKYSQFNLSPQVGYFVIDKLPVGLFMDYEYDKRKPTDSDNSWKSSSITIGPFVRYYILEYNKIWPYVEGSAGIGTIKTIEKYGSESSTLTTKTSSLKLGGGATYFVNENIGIDLFMGYKQNVSKRDDPLGSKSSAEEFKDIESSFGINLGLLVTFGK